MTKTRHRLNTVLLVAAGLLALPQPSLAVTDLGNGWDASAAEISSLPDFCKKQYAGKHGAEVLRQIFQRCDGAHHLCPGFVLLNRTQNLSIPKTERQRILGQAKKEVGYVLQRQNAQCSVKAYIDVAKSRLTMADMLLK